MVSDERVLIRAVWTKIGRTFGAELGWVRIVRGLLLVWQADAKVVGWRLLDVGGGWVRVRGVGWVRLVWRWLLVVAVLGGSWWEVVLCECLLVVVGV